MRMWCANNLATAMVLQQYMDLHSLGMQGSGIIWFDHVECTGSEAHLYDCPNDGVGIHYEDAGVTCEYSYQY